MDELTIAFKIESPPSWLPIGRTAENNWRTVEIDCSYWFNMNANGEVVLMYKPSCGMSPYPLLTERDGDNIIWRPKSGELVEGVGRLQAFFEVGTDVIGSSDMVSCEVDSSLLGVDPGTDPGQTDLPWALDIIEQIAELSGHYPKIENGVLYVWDSEQEDWAQFQGGGGNPNAVLYTAQSLTDSQKAQARTNVGAGTYSKPSGGIPKTDLAQAVQTSLGKADTALQTAPVTSVNNKTGAVTLTASDVGALPSSTSIPTKVSDLTNDSGFLTPSQIVTEGDTVIDPTLSIEGAAADAKVTGDKLSAVEYVLSDFLTDTDSIQKSDIEQGSYSDVTGSKIESNTRIRCCEPFAVASGDKFTFVPGSNAALITVMFKATSASQYTTLASWQGQTTLTFSAAGTVLIAFKRSDDSAITPSQYDATAYFGDAVSNKIEIDDTLTKSGAVADAKATGDAIAAVGNSGSVVVEMENGSYATSANRYSDNFSAYVMNRKPILLNGAEKIKISGFPTTLVGVTVLFRSNDGTAISSVSAALESGGTEFVNVPSGAFYADLQTDNFDYRKYSVILVSFGAKRAPRQAKRIYSNQGGTTIVRFHLDKETNLNTCTAFRLPPNYTSEGAAVPLVIFFAGSMEYRTISAGFASNYSAGINYVRDEGFAVMQVFSWGSEYAAKYPNCGDDQPFSVPICLFAIRKGIEYMCDRYNIDPENVHVVAKSVGGIIANYLASRPVWDFKSISMFAPCLDFISMRGRYADGRRAIAEELDLQGDLTTFFSLSYWYFSEEGKAFWSQNKEKLIQLNPAWLDMIGGNFSDNFDETFADGQAWWANKSRTDVYDQTGYYRLAKIPVKIWGAPDDPETPYPIMETTVKQLQNSGCFSELHTLPTGTGGHSADTGSGNAVASITTALGITHTNVPIAWAECVPWMLVNSPHFAREIPEPEPDPDVPADCPYNKNGLIFWLDGKTVESNSKWVDLVGGLEFALANCTKNANGVEFNGSTSVGTHTGSIIGSTIEVAFTTANTTGNISIMCQPNSAISAACGVYNANSYVVTTFGSTNYVFKPITRTGVELISATAANGANRVVINKISAGNASQSLHWDTNTSGKIAIGGRFTNSESVLWGFSGTIHSIRIYNRELTEAEMIANQNVDISRFGLSV